MKVSAGFITPLACGVVMACEPPRQPYRAVGDVQELMLTVLEPAAETYWDAVGAILDENGTHEFQPQTIEEWEAVQHAAAVVAESGNLLMLPSRVRDRGEWIELSRALVDVGERALRAAESMNPDSVFYMGGEVYDACTACHSLYALETLRPNSLPEN